MGNYLRVGKPSVTAYWSSEIQRMVFRRSWKLNCGELSATGSGHVTGVYNSCIGEWVLIGPVIWRSVGGGHWVEKGVLHVLSNRVLHYCRNLLLSIAVNKCRYCKYLHKTRHHSRMKNSNLTPSLCWISHPSLLSLAIPPWVGSMSTSKSWRVNRHTT